MTTILMKACGNVMPVATDISARIVVEHRCTLAPGHAGPHRDGAAFWLNGRELQRAIEERNPERARRRIITLPKKGM